MLGCRTHRACINLRLSSDAPRNEICRWRTRRHSRHRVPDRKRCWIRSNSAFYLCVFGGVHIAFAKRGLSRRLRLPPACAGRRASLRANPVVARATRPLHSPFADPLVGERPSARHGDELDDRSGAVLGNRYGERMGGRFGRRVRGGQDRLRRLLRCCLRSLCRTAGPPREGCDRVAAARNRQVGNARRCTRRCGRFGSRAQRRLLTPERKSPRCADRLGRLHTFVRNGRHGRALARSGDVLDGDGFGSRIVRCKARLSGL